VQYSRKFPIKEKYLTSKRAVLFVVLITYILIYTSVLRFSRNLAVLYYRCTFFSIIRLFFFVSSRSTLVNSDFLHHLLTHWPTHLTLNFSHHLIQHKFFPLSHGPYFTFIHQKLVLTLFSKLNFLYCARSSQT
jgi:hypothetical protein